jgi:mannosyltransferase OCH1-like enzyme
MTDSAEHHRQRSEFIRALVQKSAAQLRPTEACAKPIPRNIVQFWHDPKDLPQDIKACISSWMRWTVSGFTHRLFDEHSARTFIGAMLDTGHVRAFDRCYHPAMQADYFRLCYLLIEGGFYIDADDVCLAPQIDWLFDDGRLKVQPLCYEIASGNMVPPSVFLRSGAYKCDWIFYFNNNPLIAGPGHPVVQLALRRATELLEAVGENVLPEIQSTTGPGNLSKAIFELCTMSGEAENQVVVLRDCDCLSISKWPLSHRSDARNWRLSNQQRFYRRDR